MSTPETQSQTNNIGNSVTAKASWRWIPTLYFGQGVPFVVTNSLSTVLYKNLGVSNTELALYTSWLYWPWVLKPLWSPVVDFYRTKRFWVVGMQFFIGTAFAMVALTLPAPAFLQMSLAIFWLIAFSSATHDIAADGFYMLALPNHLQAAFVGVRSTFYRLATILCQGALVWVAGQLTERTGDVTFAWTLVFGLLAVLFTALALFHLFVLPKPATDQPTLKTGFVSDFAETFESFFSKNHILLILAFLLTYRLGEAQALKLVAPFLLDPVSVGGLGISTSELGISYGIYGIGALTLGGILGGLAISRHGLRAWLWPMMLCVHLPNLVFVLLAAYQPENIWIIRAALCIEQFGYGFGFAAYLLYMIMVADGPNKTAHYALCTGFMALGMMLPGMVSGWIQAQLGYTQFFIWVCICTLPSMLVAWFLKIDPAFGKKASG